MKAWYRQHVFALVEAGKHVARAPGSFLLNVLVVAVALALPFAGLTILENVRPVSEQLTVEPEISVFMAMNTPRDKAAALGTPIRDTLRELGNGAKVEFIPREKALSELRSKTGLADALAALGENPLPDGYVIKLAGLQNAADASRVDSIATQLKSLPGVDYVQVDSVWLKRLTAMLHVLRMALSLTSVTLAVVVISVVFNTIRLQVMTQSEEIAVCKLCGATNAFIYRPFCYTGALLGLAAGLAALAAVGLALNPLNKAISEFARMYASEFRLVPLGFSSIVVLLAASVGLGLIGAFLSVRRYLARG